MSSPITGKMYAQEAVMYWRLTLIVVLTLLGGCTSQQSHGENSAASNTSTPEPAAAAPAAAEPSYAGGIIDGQVLGAGQPIAKSTVNLYGATSDSPTNS
jgi:hypothetical protein